MERVEGDDEIERVAIRQARGVADREAQVRVVGDEVLAGELDHASRRIDAYDRPPREALGDLRGDLAVTATDVEDALRPFQIQGAEALVGEPLLQCRSLVVLAGVPLGHFAPSAREPTLAQPGA